MKWLTYLYTAIWDVPSWIVLFVLYSFWGQRFHWNEGFWFEFKKDSWPMRTWFKEWAGTTFGHGGFYAPDQSGEKGIDTPTEFHEHVHVEQYEASMLRSFIVGGSVLILLFSLGHNAVAVITGATIWFFGAPFTWITNWIQAALRGEKAYEGSAHEESAYAQTREFVKKKKNQK